MLATSDSCSSPGTAPPRGSTSGYHQSATSRPPSRQPGRCPAHPSIRAALPTNGSPVAMAACRNEVSNARAYCWDPRSPSAGGHPVPGKSRVHELAKELGVTSQQVLATLAALGEFVKSASSTIEAPVADRIRQRYANPHNPLGVHPPVTARRPRRYPKNNPYSDLGQDPYPHDRAVERRPPSARSYDHPRPRRPGDAPPPPPPVVSISSRPRGPRREWWRGDAPGDLTRYLLDEMIAPRRPNDSATGARPLFRGRGERGEGVQQPVGTLPAAGHGLRRDRRLDPHAR